MKGNKSLRVFISLGFVHRDPLRGRGDDPKVQDSVPLGVHVTVVIITTITILLQYYVNGKSGGRLTAVMLHMPCTSDYA